MTAELKLKTLESNLQEITHSGDHPLVADPLGCCLFESNRGWGRLWTWYYRILDGLFGLPKLQKGSLEKALLKTKECFEKQELKFLENAEAFKKCIVDGEKRDPLIAKKLHRWEEISSDYLKKIATVADKTLFPNSKASPNQQQNLSRCLLIIALESMTETPLPSEPLRKLLCNEKLEKEDEDILCQWIQILLQKKISTGHLHRALLAFTEIIGEGSLVKLEMALIKKGYKLFLKPDPSYMAWRDSLKKGSIVEVNGREITLGPRLEKDPGNGKKQVVYTLADDPKRVMILYPNEAIAAIKEDVGKISAWGIPFVDVEEVDREGKCLLVERGELAFGNQEWTSSGDTVSEEEAKILTPLCNLYKWFSKCNRSPQDFVSTNLVFTSKGILKSLRPYPPGVYDYVNLEMQLWVVSGNNPLIFKYLMKKSKLHNRQETKYFHEVVESALKDTAFNYEQGAIIHTIKDPSSIIKQAKQLYRMVKALIAQKYKHSKKSPETLEKIKEEFLEQYQESFAGSLLEPLKKAHACSMTPGDTVATK